MATHSDGACVSSVRARGTKHQQGQSQDQSRLGRDGVRSCVLAIWVALLPAASAAAQQTQQQVEQYDEPDELALREYVDIRINALDLLMQNGLSTSKEAVEKAERATELRFNSVNEFRGQLDDQQRTFMPRLEYEQAHNALINRVDELTKRVDDREARAAGVIQIWPIMFGIVGVVGIFFGIFMAMRRPIETTLK